MSQAKTVKEALIAAKWLLEHYGWSVGANYRDAVGKPCGIDQSYYIASMCLHGALCATECTSRVANDMFDLVYSVLPERVSSFATFNDLIANSKSDVIAVLDKAIDKA